MLDSQPETDLQFWKPSSRVLGLQLIRWNTTCLLHNPGELGELASDAVIERSVAPSILVVDVDIILVGEELPNHLLMAFRCSKVQACSAVIVAFSDVYSLQNESLYIREVSSRAVVEEIHEPRVGSRFSLTKVVFLIDLEIMQRILFTQELTELDTTLTVSVAI